MKTITLQVRANDAEPWLRKAAYDAAKYSAYCDYITSKTHDSPVNDPAQVKAWFLQSKRLVEAFGVEYEQTSEQETLTVHYDWVGGKRVNRGMFTEIVGSVQDFKHPRPAYRREVHSQACHAAAERVVRKWKETL